MPDKLEEKYNEASRKTMDQASDFMSKKFLLGFERGGLYCGKRLRDNLEVYKNIFNRALVTIKDYRYSKDNFSNGDGGAYIKLRESVGGVVGVVDCCTRLKLPYFINTEVYRLFIKVLFELKNGGCPKWLYDKTISMSIYNLDRNKFKDELTASARINTLKKEFR